MSDSSHFLSNFSATSPEVLQPIPADATLAYPYTHAMQALSQIRIPNYESAAMTRAFLAVLNSPTTSSTPPLHRRRAASSFRRYFASDSGPPSSNSVSKQSLLKRVIVYYRRMNSARRRDGFVGSRPGNSQLHHMMSERKRREKLNENFQALRSLVPPDTKRDKASLLASAKEQLKFLKQHVAELRQKNQVLEESRRASGDHGGTMWRSETSDVKIRSTEQHKMRIVDVKVRVVRECTMVDVLIQLLEFLKRQQHVKLTAVEVHSGGGDDVISAPRNEVSLQLKIQGDEWEDSAFLRAIRGLTDDLADIVNWPHTTTI